MFSKTPLQKLSLGAAGAIWLALGSVESANAASFKSFSTISINQPLELASIRLGNGNARANSSNERIRTALIAAGSLVAIVLIAIEISRGDNDRKGSGGGSKPKDDFKILQGFQVKTKGQALISSNLSGVATPVPTGVATPVPTPVPSPALLPGLLALGWKMMQKRRSEQSGVI